MHCDASSYYKATRTKFISVRCQLFLGQAQLKPATAQKLKEVMAWKGDPARGIPRQCFISDSDLAAMQLPPMRSFDAEILKVMRKTYHALGETLGGDAVGTLPKSEILPGCNMPAICSCCVRRGSLPLSCNSDSQGNRILFPDESISRLETLCRRFDASSHAL